MPRIKQWQRLNWLHQRLKHQRFPNSFDLVQQFEISRRQAYRDIDTLRLEYHAPLEYDSQRRGFYYADQFYEMPGLWLDEQSALALVLAVRLASTRPDRRLKDTLCHLVEQVTGIHGQPSSSCLALLEDKISVKNIAYTSVDAAIFRQTVEALFQKQALHINYQSPHSGGSQRTIVPLHLMQYMGNWHLLAWCCQRQAQRIFSLGRIRSMTPANGQCSIPTDLPPAKDYLRQYFGIMQGQHSHNVCLRFLPAQTALLCRDLSEEQASEMITTLQETADPKGGK